MSIFKSTLKPFVAAQLKAREKVIGQVDASGNAGVGARNQDFLKYVAGKNAWIKMSSFVKYTSHKFDLSKKRWVPDGRYKGTELAKKYVLEGGTLTSGTRKGPDGKETNTYSLRSGVFGRGAIYGSEIDKISTSGNTIDRLYGIRPMPGIESATITNISAYGSLREATITFYAWDRHQLEELEVLYMRPGYTVLLEWGWSQYIDHDIQNNGDINSYPSNIKVKNFINGLDIFDSSFSTIEEDIYTAIDKKVISYKGNYDAMLGFVKNFSWQLMPNGGFQCTTVLISRGEALETLKASTNPNVVVGSRTNVEQEIIEASDKPVLSYFEKIFLGLIGYFNDSEITATGRGQLATPTVDAQGQPTNITSEQITAVRRKTSEIGAQVISKVNQAKYKAYDKGNIVTVTGFDLVNQGAFIKPIDGGINGSALEYISMDSLIAILNTLFILKIETDKGGIGPNLVDIVLPRETPFLISEDTVSVDPTTCLLSNSKATFVTGDRNGFVPEVFLKWEVDPTTGFITATSGQSLAEINGESNNNKNYIGHIGKIYISIQKVIDIYRGLYSSSGGEGVGILDLLSNLLESINLALGGINNFKLYTDKNIVQIIDAHYLEGKNGEGASSKKFILDPMGLKNVCRDVRINSKIFSEQSTMIAIAAAAGGKNNIGDIYNSTQAALNKGLVDRVASEKLRYAKEESSSSTVVTINGKKYTGDVTYYLDILQNVVSLRNHLKYKVLGVTGYGNTATNFKITRVPQENDIINASSLLRTIHYQINGRDVDFKALIPFELEITLDGLAGFVTGQIFRIDKSILPREYQNKNLGFVITKQNNSLRNNDWTTTLTTQICMLDNDDYPYDGLNKEDLVAVLKKLEQQLTQSGYVKGALIDYLIFITKRSLENTNKRINNSTIPTNIDQLFLDDFALEASTVRFKGYRASWIRSFQPPNADGTYTNNFTSEYYHPEYRKSLNITSDPTTTSLPYFPKVKEDGSVEDFTTTLSDGKVIKFDDSLVDRFVFNDELYNAYVYFRDNGYKQPSQNIPLDFFFFSKDKIIITPPEEVKIAKEKILNDATIPNADKLTKFHELILASPQNVLTGPGLMISEIIGSNNLRSIAEQTIAATNVNEGFSFLNTYLLFVKYFNLVSTDGGYLQRTNSVFNYATLDKQVSVWFPANRPANPSAMTDEGLKYFKNNWRTSLVKPKISSSSSSDGSVFGTGNTGTSNPNNPSVGGTFSDINLKENIELIGKSNNGINIYKFKYKNQEGYYQGVIAQELIGTEFESALIFENNYYKVNYNNIDVEFKVL